MHQSAHKSSGCVTPGCHINIAADAMCAGFEQPSDVGKQVTEVIPHPATGDADDREAYASAALPMDAAPSTIVVSGPEYDAEPEVIDSGATRDVGVQVSSPQVYTQNFTSASCLITCCGIGLCAVHVTKSRCERETNRNGASDVPLSRAAS